MSSTDAPSESPTPAYDDPLVDPLASGPSGYTSGITPIDHDPYEEVEEYVQVFGTRNVTTIIDEEFLAAPFSELCPSGDCVKACSNLTRLFSPLPSGINDTLDTYGRPDSEQRITLFGVCTNLDRATNIVPLSNTTDEVKAFFPSFSLSKGNVSLVTASIASCFASTCDLTREPSKCEEACAVDNFLAGPTQLNFNLQNPNTGALACIQRLCDNTCGLPYADADLLGMGVLVSYYIQTILLVLVAAAFVGSALWQAWKWPQEKPAVHPKLKHPLETWLKVQCYFGITAAVASCFMGPSSIEPLNGFALICVSVMGFLPPVFTLALCHSHGLMSLFRTGLVLASFAMNSAVFFLLHRNLVDVDADAVRAGIENLFSATTCGGDSAISLCKQMTDMEPLTYLNAFFNKGPIPNIDTIPVLWGWTTVVLFALIVHQALPLSKSRATPSDSLEGPNWAGKPQQQQLNMKRKTRAVALYQNPWLRAVLLLLVVLLFGLALGYQFRIVYEYQRMDVIDADDWSFGQIVAILFWVPPFIDVIYSLSGGQAYHSLNQKDSTPPNDDAVKLTFADADPYLVLSNDKDSSDTQWKRPMPVAYSSAWDVSAHDDYSQRLMARDNGYSS